MQFEVKFMIFRVFKISQSKARTLNRWCGKLNQFFMAYSLSNNCTKNYWKRTTTAKIIVEGFVVYFFATQCSWLQRAMFPTINFSVLNNISYRIVSYRIGVVSDYCFFCYLLQLIFSGNATASAIHTNSKSFFIIHPACLLKRLR